MTTLGARPRPEPSRVVGCPHCSRRYLLPRRLMGPGGARVRCPGCQESFDVTPEPARLVGARTGPPRRDAACADDREAAPADREARSAHAIAREVVEELVAHARAMLEAQARGRLFAETGPLLLGAFDLYRHRAGAEAGAEVFREALGRRWGINLPAAPPGTGAAP